MSEGFALAVLSRVSTKIRYNRTTRGEWKRVNVNKQAYHVRYVSSSFKIRTHDAPVKKKINDEK